MYIVADSAFTLLVETLHKNFYFDCHLIVKITHICLFLIIRLVKPFIKIIFNYKKIKRKWLLQEKFSII